MTGSILYIANDENSFKELQGKIADFLPDSGFCYVPSTQLASSSLLEESSIVILSDCFELIDILLKRMKKNTHLILSSKKPLTETIDALYSETGLISTHHLDQSAPNFAEYLGQTLKKIKSNDLFGVEKYLKTKTEITEYKIRLGSEREALAEKVKTFSKEKKLKSSIRRMLYGATVELVSNALYDAPLAAGVIQESSTLNPSRIELPEELSARLRVGFDGNICALSICDPFGKMTAEVFFKYASKVKFRNETSKLIDTKTTGAGLGFYKMIYTSHSLICNVSSNNKTEFIILLHSHCPLRDISKSPRNIQFFREKKIICNML